MNVPAPVIHICEVLRNAGHEAWLVGGAVRDSIMGREAHDFDVATNALPTRVIRLFPRVIETGIAHGTVTVLLDGVGYEVTTYRGEEGYSDGRHPDAVRFLDSIEADLSRRDFTVNAIAYDPLNDAFCDPYNGRGDIEARVLRAVGDPAKRFAEDGLRPLRAARFAATLGFEIEPATLAAIPNTLETFRCVSIERVQAEWAKIMNAPRPSRAFRVMAETGMLAITAPEFIPMSGCTQNKYHAFDVWEHTLRVLDACPASDPILRMGALFHDIGKPLVKGVNPITGDATFYDHELIGADVCKEVLTRMRFSNADRDRVVHLVRHHYIRCERNWSKGTIRRWVRRVGLNHMASLCTLARADIAGKGPAMVELEPGLIDELERRVSELGVEAPMLISTQVLVVNGNDIMAHLGIGPGPNVGKVLKALLEIVTDDPSANTREHLLEATTQIWCNSSGGPDAQIMGE